jgi:hypothetical protein
MVVASQPTLSVASAAFRALAAWLAIYVVISQVLVISKWRSSSAVAQEMVVVVVAEKVFDETVNIVRDCDAKLVEQHEQDEKIQRIHKVIQKLKQEEDRQQGVVTSTEEQLKILRDQVFRPLSKGDESTKPTVTGVSPNLTSLKQLLELSTLSNIPSNALMQLSKAMRNQVDAISAANATVEWSEVTEVVTARYERRDEPARECPSKPMDLSLASESHFHQKFQQVEALIQQRARNVPPLLNQDGVLEPLLEQASNPPPVVETSDSDPTCVSQQHVVSMVGEGLDALQRRLDLRRVLKKYLLSNFQEIAKKDLILDALLDPPFQPSRERETLNLRQILDTPLSKEWPKWVDSVVDMMSGYDDVLDQAVDRLAAQDFSVGQAVLSKIQTLAGKVEVPNVLSKAPSKARMSRQG